MWQLTAGVIHEAALWVSFGGYHSITLGRIGIDAGLIPQPLFQRIIAVDVVGVWVC